MSTKVGYKAYQQTGVDTAEADAGLNHIIARVQATWPTHGLGRVALPIGYFANVIEMDGMGVALCTDGVGFEVPCRRNAKEIRYDRDRLRGDERQ